MLFSLASGHVTGCVRRFALRERNIGLLPISKKPLPEGKKVEDDEEERKGGVELCQRVECLFRLVTYPPH